MTPNENQTIASTSGLNKAPGGFVRNAGIFALSIVLAPALAAFVIIGTGGASFFRDRW